MNCPVRLLHYEVPVARGAEGGALRDAMSLCLSVRLFDCRLKRVFVGHWSDWPSSAGRRERPARCWASQSDQ